MKKKIASCIYSVSSSDVFLVFSLVSSLYRYCSIDWIRCTKFMSFGSTVMQRRCCANKKASWNIWTTYISADSCIASYASFWINSWELKLFTISRTSRANGFRGIINCVVCCNMDDSSLAVRRRFGCGFFRPRFYNRNNDKKNNIFHGMNNFFILLFNTNLKRTV